MLVRGQNRVPLSLPAVSREPRDTARFFRTESGPRRRPQKDRSGGVDGPALRPASGTSGSDPNGDPLDRIIVQDRPRTFADPRSLPLQFRGPGGIVRRDRQGPVADRHGLGVSSDLFSDDLRPTTENGGKGLTAGRTQMPENVVQSIADLAGITPPPVLTWKRFIPHACSLSSANARDNRAPRAAAASSWAWE